MSVIATAVAALIEAGVSGDLLVAAIAKMEAAQAAAAMPVRTARQERNARYYKNRKTRIKTSEASEGVLIQTPKTLSDAADSENGSPHLSNITTPEKKDLPSEAPKKRGANEEAGLAAIAALGTVPPVADDATALHDAAETALLAAGFLVHREYPVTLTNGAAGRIDLAAWLGDGMVVLELDRRMPRAKSVAKMAGLEAFRIAGIRAPADSVHRPADVDALVGFTVFDVPKTAKPRRFDWPNDAEDRFWSAYPRHTDRKKAMAALQKIRKADAVAFEDIIAGAHRLRASGTEPEFLPHASTWLNGERWTDVIPGGSSRAGPAWGHGRDSAATILLKRDAEARRDQSPREPDFFDVPAGRADAGGRPARDASPQRDRMGGAGPILDLVPVRSFGR